MKFIWGEMKNAFKKNKKLFQKENEMVYTE